jgi:chlorite dismutase
MKLSSREQLLTEASKVLSEIRKEGTSYVYSPSEVSRIKQSIGLILDYTQDSIEELNESESVLRKLRADLEDSQNGDSLTSTQMSQFMKGVFGFNRQGKSVTKLMRETEKFVKLLGR